VGQFYRWTFAPRDGPSSWRVAQAFDLAGISDKVWGLVHTLQFSYLHHLEIGCPTRRGFRRVGTMDPPLVHASQTRIVTLCYLLPVPNKLHRYYGAGYLHFITTSCYQRSPLLGTAQNRDLFLEVLERVRRRYGFVVVGYVIMPEHVHLLFSEPDRGDPSVVMKVLKQSFARRLLGRMRRTGDARQSSLWNSAVFKGHVWQHRFYDFVVFTEKKRVEKLRYMHRNPVVRGLVLEPEQWKWSTYRHYALGELGPVLVNEA
jgi:putative transposase